MPVDTATGTAGPPIRLSHIPGPMVMAPDGRTLYVVLDSPTGTRSLRRPDRPGWVIPINLATQSAGHPITVGYEPTDIAITPDGSTLCVANQDSNTISVIPLNH